MTTFSAALHDDNTGLKTSAVYGDIGDGSNNWAHNVKAVDGALPSVGAKADTAVTSPASSGSLIALLKGLMTNLGTGATALLKAEDAAHVSGDTGIPSWGVVNEAKADLGSTAGDYHAHSTDRYGSQFVHLVPPDSLAYRLSSTWTTALAASLIIKASAGSLHKLRITNTAGFLQYIQLHNSASVPADTTVPQMSVAIPISGFLELDFTVYGRYFSTGIVVCNSTAPAVKTIGVADCFFEAQYL